MISTEDKTMLVKDALWIAKTLAARIAKRGSKGKAKCWLNYNGIVAPKEAAKVLARALSRKGLKAIEKRANVFVGGKVTYRLNNGKITYRYKASEQG